MATQTQCARARTKHQRVPPRKARLAADLIRGRGVEEAVNELGCSALKAAGLLRKVLISAVANAQTRFGQQREDLYVREVRVDCGAVLKRGKSKNKGGRVPVMKRTSHFTVVVGPKQL